MVEIGVWMAIFQGWDELLYKVSNITSYLGNVLWHKHPWHWPKSPTYSSMCSDDQHVHRKNLHILMVLVLCFLNHDFLEHSNLDLSSFYAIKPSQLFGRCSCRNNNWLYKHIVLFNFSLMKSNRQKVNWKISSAHIWSLMVLSCCYW